jgi:SAM-dependent methyltransferase
LQWAERIRPAWDHEDSGASIFMHRKLWEWLFIIQGMFERGKLAPGMRGLGFGVGQEPLASIFASFGCEIVATDLDLERATAAGWADGNQYSTDSAQLNQYGLCDREDFERLVKVRVLDMNSIPQDLRGFDFTWSSCAFEHLGTIQNGLRFLVEQMRCVRPGGVAIHTTEYNVSSDESTISEGPTVIFRRQDIESVVTELG